MIYRFKIIILSDMAKTLRSNRKFAVGEQFHSIRAGYSILVYAVGLDIGMLKILTGRNQLFLMTEDDLMEKFKSKQLKRLDTLTKDVSLSFDEHGSWVQLVL